MKYIAAGIIGKMSDAEDIVQQAYSIAIEKNQSFGSRDQFLGWLAGVVKYCALNVRRKRIRRKTSAVDPSDMQSFVVDSSSTDTSKIDIKNLESLKGSFDDEVMRALGNISDDARTCLLLKSVENMSYKEIATLVQIPEGTAMSMVHRARTALRRELADHDFARTSDIGKGNNQ